MFKLLGRKSKSKDKDGNKVRDAPPATRAGVLACARVCVHMNGACIHSFPNVRATPLRGAAPPPPPPTHPTPRAARPRLDRLASRCWPLVAGLSLLSSAPGLHLLFRPIRSTPCSRHTCAARPTRCAARQQGALPVPRAPVAQTRPPPVVQPVVRRRASSTQFLNEPVWEVHSTLGQGNGIMYGEANVQGKHANVQSGPRSARGRVRTATAKAAAAAAAASLPSPGHPARSRGPLAGARAAR